MAESLSNQNKRTIMENSRKLIVTNKSLNANWKDDKCYVNDNLTLF